MKNTKEEWKDVPMFCGYIQASNMGRIKSLPRTVNKRALGIQCVQHYKERILSQVVRSKYGHVSVRFGINGAKYTEAVHRLVLFAFVGLPEIGQEACHNNGDASDNRPENLRWASHKENNRDRKRHGRYAVGENHPMATLPRDVAMDIRNSSLTAKQLSELHGIRYNRAWAIKTGRSWAEALG